MAYTIDKDACIGCGACQGDCPVEAISDAGGVMEIDAEKCIDCGLCEKTCPIIHTWWSDDSRTTTAIAAINQNENIRLRSSSGGIFTLIAEEILNQGGVVFGAAFDDDFKSVHHIFVDNTDDLEKLQGSKYVQSKIGDTYKQAEDYLEGGRKVLFTGTPCQIGGLYSYLKKPYNNLLTQDIICHGVPSPMVWEKYVEERERKADAKTHRLFFRHKKYGWKTFSVLFEFSNNTVYVKNLLEDSFMRAFLSNSCLRPSCHECSFKSIKRQADITLADFWGVQDVLHDMDDDKGTSLVLIHSERGQELVKEIMPSIRMESVAIEVLSKHNSAANHSAELSQYRSEYMKRVISESPDKLASEYFKIPIKRKIRLFFIKTGLMKIIKKRFR